MPSIVTHKLSFHNAEQFKEAFSEANTPSISYVFIGNNVPYANESSPDPIVETVNTEKQAWDNMFAAKKITGNDLSLVIPRFDWTANTKYRSYDDTIEFGDLFTANTTQNLKPMYVFTSGRNVYKCVSNNNSANSTVEPSGDYNTSNGNIGTADGYIWKYMFNVSSSNKFLDDNWVPAPTSTDALDFGVSPLGVVDGELTSIIVTNSGTNYRQASNIKFDGFTSGQTSLKLSNTNLVLEIFSIPTLANLANMSISGTGISTGSYITSLSTITGIINLSAATTSAGGNANNITVSTRVYIEGDGTGAIALATLSNTSSQVSAANANVSKISVTTIGTGYGFANAFIYGSGTNANCRVVLPPKFGHAYNPAKELNANNVMVSVRIGEIDSSENGLISTDTSFRQVGLLRDPYKYSSTVVANTSTANSVISQTTNLSVVAGLSYTLNEYVYQGSVNNPTAYAFVNAQTTNEVRLTKVKGTFLPGLSLNGLTSGVSRTIVSVTNPEFKPYAGDILYIDNELKIDRVDGQAENIKFVVKF